MGEVPSKKIQTVCPGILQASSIQQGQHLARLCLLEPKLQSCRNSTRSDVPPVLCCRPSLFDGSWMTGVFSHQQLQRPQEEAFSDLNNILNVKRRNVSGDLFQKQGLAANWLQSEEREQRRFGKHGKPCSLHSGPEACIRVFNLWSPEKDFIRPVRIR